MLADKREKILEPLHFWKKPELKGLASQMVDK